MVSWQDAEKLLINYAKSDILIVLDCCYAGTVFSGSKESDNDRIVEVLVATAREEYTARPGQFSFTTAFVKAMKALRADGKHSISTSELIQKILRDTPRSAASRVEKANLHWLVTGPSEKHIMLARPRKSLDKTCASREEEERPASKMESWMSILRLALETG